MAQQEQSEQQEQSDQRGATQEPSAAAPDAPPAVESAEKAPATDEAAPAKEQLEEYRALLQRERADFINYRRRVEQERAVLLSQARADALVPVLPLLDDLERAAADVPPDLRDQPWVKGVLLIAEKLASAMRAAGLERVDALGQPFDPRYHEAFLYQPHLTIPAGHVSLVMRPGYRVGDRVIRPAQVAVSQGNGEEGGQQEES